VCRWFFAAAPRPPRSARDAGNPPVDLLAASVLNRAVGNAFPRKTEPAMNPRKLFVTSCLALVTTSMVFSIRGDIIDAVSADFHITKEQMGVVLSPAFWGFTLSIIIGGSLVDFFGMRRLLALSSLGYIGALLLIIFAPRPAAPVAPYYSDTGFICLYAGMLTLG